MICWVDIWGFNLLYVLILNKLFELVEELVFLLVEEVDELYLNKFVEIIVDIVNIDNIFLNNLFFFIIIIF